MDFELQYRFCSIRWILPGGYHCFYFPGCTKQRTTTLTVQGSDWFWYDHYYSHAIQWTVCDMKYVVFFLFGPFFLKNWATFYWLFQRNNTNYDTIVPFHKSQCALWYLDLMSKSRTLPANALRSRDWSSRPVCKCVIGLRLSAMSVFSQLPGDPKMKWLGDWSHTVHRPRPWRFATVPHSWK